MEKITVKQLKSLHLTTVLAAVLLLLSMNLKKFDCLSTAVNPAAVCNATVIEDCLPENEEFMMESEISRRLLVVKRKTITYQGLNAGKPFCDLNVYASCISRPNKFFEKRACNYRNQCQRAG